MTSKVYLVTGANSGLGLDAVRQLALRKDVSKVYMACRSQAKAQSAIDSLSSAGTKISRNKLQYVHFDCSDNKVSIERIVSDIQQPLDGVILNAGGLGHDPSGKPKGPNGLVDMYQVNIVGHIQLVELLKTNNLLKTGARIVFSGSEAARGVPIMGIGNPKLGSTTAWYQDQLTGSTKSRRFDAMKTYSIVKGTAALYFAEWARRNPTYVVLVVSPGATGGTEAATAQAMPKHFQVMMPIMMPVMMCMKVFHELEVGTKRYIDAVMGEGDMASFESGTFVASRKGVSGAVTDQKLLKFGRQYGDRAKQEAAYSALSAYV